MTDISVFKHDGHDAAVSPDLFCQRLERARMQIALPFAKERIDLVAAVSAALMSGNVDASPAVIHFAFWTRMAALQRLKASYQMRVPPDTQARARGLCLHLPPQNVETVFLYSWVLAYLAGNANVVRLPTALSNEMRNVCNLFLAAFEKRAERAQFFVHYSSDSDVSARLSAQSDARLVWGGDAKIALFAPLPLRSGGKALWFGDRFSFCVMKGDAVTELDETGLGALAQKMDNDIFLFEQMACASPHVLYVVGNIGTHLAGVNMLLERLVRVARAHRPIPATGHLIRKMVEVCVAAGSGDAVAASWTNNLMTSVVAASPQRQERRVGGGFLRVAFIASLGELAGLVREHDQTITHFGFSGDEITEAANALVGFGVSRWAPVGSALEVDFVWDGYDIPFELSRLVRVGGPLPTES